MNICRKGLYDANGGKVAVVTLVARVRIKKACHLNHEKIEDVGLRLRGNVMKIFRFNCNITIC